MQRILTLLLALGFAAACARLPNGTQADQPQGREDVTMLAMVTLSPDEEAVEAQARAVERAAQALVRRAAGTGLGAGAIVGCGAALAGAGDARACAMGAARAGIAGAMAGTVAGQTSVERRVARVSPGHMVRDIRRTRDTLDGLGGSLPRLLAAQDAELNAMAMALAQGEITDADYAARLEAVRGNRNALVASLTRGETAMHKAGEVLRRARAAGATGLDWHLAETEALQRDVTSARAAISLL